MKSKTKLSKVVVKEIKNSNKEVVDAVNENTQETATGNLQTHNLLSNIAEILNKKL